MGEKGKGFTETIIKDTWTITRGGGNRGRWWGEVGKKGRKLYLNNNKKNKRRIVASLKFSDCAFYSSFSPKSRKQLPLIQD